MRQTFPRSKHSAPASASARWRLASGITPDNAHAYADVDCFMVATGINHQGNFYDIDPARLNRLMRITRKLGGGTPS
jgi:hypothetical protein